MVLVGCQLPALGIELIGSVSFLDIEGHAGQALIVAAVATLVAVALHSRAGLSLSAIALWVALLWPALRAGYERVFPPERDVFDQIGDAVGSAVGDALEGTVSVDDLFRITELKAGAFVLPAGCLLVSVAAFRRRR
jgi:hypothetical protein